MIFLDVDGVLCDFNTAAQRALGLPVGPVYTWDWFLGHGLTEAEFWAGIHLYGDDFYREMVEPYPWAEELLSTCQRTDTTFLLTACAQDPRSWAGKKIICDRLAPGVPVIMTKHKYLLAGPIRLLIDDKRSNIEKFRRAGGESLLFPQPWNGGAYTKRGKIWRERLAEWQKQTALHVC